MGFGVWLESEVYEKGLQTEVVNKNLGLVRVFNHMFSDGLDHVLEPSMCLLTKDN